MLSVSKLSIVVPCYNEEETIPIFYQSITTVLLQLMKNQDITDYEIIFIDDGSIDNTFDVIHNLSLKDSHIHYSSFSRNFGKEAALLCGLRQSTGKYVVTMDVDLQDPPTLIPDMLHVVQEGIYDCAGTRRVTRKGEPPIRSASKGIFPWVGFKTKWFEYENIERTSGKTKWSFWSLFLYSLDGITAFSSRPLVFASIMGITALFIAFCLVVFIIIRKIIFGDPTAGWPSLVCIILTLSGLQLFCTGVLGQYLAKIYNEVKHRPNYIIKKSR